MSGLVILGMKAAHQCCGRLVRLQTQPGLVVREVTRDWIRDGWNPIATGKANTPSQLARMFSPFRSPVLTIGLRWREFPASRKSRYPGRTIHHHHYRKLGLTAAFGEGGLNRELEPVSVRMSRKCEEDCQRRRGAMGEPRRLQESG
jgi:hypothetical protein